MSVTVEDIKKVLHQYGLVKGNSAVNAAVIDRASQIIFREFQVTLKSDALLEQDLVDLSGVTASSSQAAPVAGQKPTPAGARPPKTFEEQVAEVEAARAAPPPPLPSPGEKAKLLEGQRAIPTAQQDHFRSVINKHVEAKPAERRGVRSVAETEALREDAGEEQVEEVEEGGEEAIVEPEHLSNLFEDGALPVGNPKDAMALQNSLPRKMGEGASTKGSGRSITRLT